MEFTQIKRRDGEKRIDLFKREPFVVLTGATLNSSLMGDDYITLNIVSCEWIDFAKGDYIEFEGVPYTIRTTVERVIEGDHRYTFAPVFYGPMYDLIKTIYRNCDATGKSDRSTFDLTYTLKEFGRVIVYNLNRDYPGMWAFDETNCPDTEAKTISFSGNNCLQVLQTLCSKDNFNYEFQIDYNKGVRTIKIGKFGKKIVPPGGTEYFEYGRGGGLYTLKEAKVDDKSIITRLWVEGGTNNIRTDYRNYAERLQLPYPKRLNEYAHTLRDGTVIEPETQEIGIEDDSMRYFEDEQLKAAIGSEEDTKNYDNIYPTRTGKVTAIVEDDINAFVDDTMDFDLNLKEGNKTKYLVDGVSAKINFTSGLLAGQQFELVAKGGYDNEAKKFKIIPFTDNRGLTIPTTTTTAYRIRVGDTYKITDIFLPGSYEHKAEEDLWYEGLQDFNDAKQAKAQYTLTLDRLYFLKLQADGVSVNFFKCGDYVPVKDNRYKIEKYIRIQKITRNLMVEQNYELTLSDTTTISISTQTVLTVLDHENVININSLRDLNKARRGWRTTEDLRNMVYDPDGYFDVDNIRPNSIDTNMLTVGSKSQQFVLSGVILQANVGGNPNVFEASSGTLSHLTISEAGIRNWNLAGEKFTLTSNDGYYVFARCSKSGTSGSWYVTKEPLKFEPDFDAANYYFQVGIISTLREDENFRDFVTTYGFTRINGNTITTGRIVTSDGNCYLDLDGSKFRIGDADSYIDYNVSRPKRITLHNVNLVSESGEETPVGCFRGEWDADTVYYKGDEVTYTKNGRTSTYRYVSDTPQKGIVPGTTADWMAIAVGADGNSVLVMFSPDGLTWDTIPSPTDKFWRISYDGGEHWSEPYSLNGAPGQDGRYLATQWAKNYDSANPPTEGWSTTPETALPGEYVWMRQGWVTPPATEPSEWMDAIRLTGTRGSDGEATYVLTCDNEMQCIVCVANGFPKDQYTPITARYTVRAGAEILTSGVTFAIGGVENMAMSGATISSSGQLSIDPQALGTGDKTVNVSVKATVTMNNGKTLVMTSVFTLARVLPGADGQSIKAQYSSDGTNWHDTMNANDKYWRTSADGGVTWSAANEFKGANGESIKAQYSTNGITWHDTMNANDKYWRTSADGGVTWSAANEFKGANGDNAIVYQVEPSVGVIYRDMLGSLSPTTLTFSEYKIDGANARTKVSQHYIYVMQSGAVEVENMTTVGLNKFALCNGTFKVNPTATDIIAELRDADNDVLDRQTVSILTDVSEMQIGGANLLSDTNKGTKGWRIGVYATDDVQQNWIYHYQAKLAAKDKGCRWDTSSLGQSQFTTWYRNLIGDTKGLYNKSITIVNYTMAFTPSTPPETLQPGYYVLSFDLNIEGVSGQKYRFNAELMDASDTTVASFDVWSPAVTGKMHYSKAIKITKATTFTKFSLLFKVEEMPAGKTTYAQTALTISNLMLQHGNVSTDWVPSNDERYGQSPALVYRGEWDSANTYYGTPTRVDCVKFGSAWYVAATDAGTFQGIPPTASGQSVWKEFGASFQSVATSLLLAENANIANFIFRNERMESQTQDVDGNPNVFLDGKKGVVFVNGSIINPFKRINTSNVSQYLEITDITSSVKRVSFDIEKIGLKAMLECSLSEIYNTLGISVTTQSLFLPYEMKYAGTEFEIYYSGTGDFGLMGAILSNMSKPWDPDNPTYSPNSLVLPQGTYARFRCVPVLASHHTLSGYTKFGNYYLAWILLEKYTI